MTLIRVLKSPYSKGVTLDVNAQRAFVPSDGDEADIPAELLPALADSHIEYEIVGAADEAGEGAKGDSGEPPAEIAEPEEEAQEENEPVNDEVPDEPTILDDNVPNIVAQLPGLADSDVEALLAAERAGKTRKTLIAAMEERLNPPQE